MFWLMLGGPEAQGTLWELVASASGATTRQRTAPALAPRISPFQEDDMYYKFQMGRVNAEMVRPYIGAPLDCDWGGYRYESMAVAGLARAIQARLYLHTCGPYCLHGRNACRFFYPWPLQWQQQYCANTTRVALQRRLPEDDQWVVPHNLALAMFSPSTVNVLPFDPSHNADQARQYGSKYTGKPDEYYHVEGLQEKANPVKDLLLGRCLERNALVGFQEGSF